MIEYIKFWVAKELVSIWPIALVSLIAISWVIIELVKTLFEYLKDIFFGGWK